HAALHLGRRTAVSKVAPRRIDARGTLHREERWCDAECEREPPENVAGRPRPPALELTDRARRRVDPCRERAHRPTLRLARQRQTRGHKVERAGKRPAVYGGFPRRRFALHAGGLSFAERRLSFNTTGFGGTLGRCR